MNSSTLPSRARYQAALRDACLDYDDRLVVNVLNNGPALTAVSDLFDAEHPDGYWNRCIQSLLSSL